MTDRLTLAHALENGGINRDAAEQIATEIFDAIHDNVATKTDLRESEQRLLSQIDGVRADLRDVEGRLRADIALVEHRLITRLGGAVAAATSILIAVHYIH